MACTQTGPRVGSVDPGAEYDSNHCLVFAQSGQSALSIADQLGYISVVEMLRQVTQVSWLTWDDWAGDLTHVRWLIVERPVSTVYSRPAGLHLGGGGVEAGNSGDSNDDEHWQVPTALTWDDARAGHVRWWWRWRWYVHAACWHLLAPPIVDNYWKFSL